MPSDDDTRQSFQEAMALVELSAKEGGAAAKRFMGTRAAWLPGSDIMPQDPEQAQASHRGHTAAYGGHVYTQSGLAVCRAWKELEDKRGVKDSERLGIHVRLSAHSHAESEVSNSRLEVRQF
jgi:hypothetical protein